MGDIGLFQKLSTATVFGRFHLFPARFTPRGKDYKRYAHYSLDMTFGFFYIVGAYGEKGEKAENNF